MSLWAKTTVELELTFTGEPTSDGMIAGIELGSVKLFGEEVITLLSDAILRALASNKPDGDQFE
jgi:hypothetical protein